MKKLLLLFATILISLNSMALSFPRSTYGQQRSIHKVANKSISITEEQALKTAMKAASVETKMEEETNQVSFIEMFANYIISLFTEKLLNNKSLAFSSFQKERCEYLAIKQDFETSIIG